jgi:hypothetical protein
MKIKNALRAIQKERAELAILREHYNRKLTELAQLKAEVEQIAFEQRERVQSLITIVERHNDKLITISKEISKHNIDEIKQELH